VEECPRICTQAHSAGIGDFPDWKRVDASSADRCMSVVLCMRGAANASFFFLHEGMTY